MNKMTAQEIIDYLESFDLNTDGIAAALEDFGYSDLTLEQISEIEAKLGKWEQVEDGFEDRDTQIATYHFPEHDCYIKFSGYYSSYGDNDYTDWSEVRPITKTVVVYE